MRPEGNLLVSTELSSNFLPVAARRPSSAREEFRRRRDNLRSEGNVRGNLSDIARPESHQLVQVSYQVEAKSSYTAHQQTARPKIYKPRPCGDCSAPGKSAGPIVPARLPARREEEILSREQKMIRPAEKPRVLVELREPAVREPAVREPVLRETAVRESKKTERLPGVLPAGSVRGQEVEREPEADWPSWSSQPLTLGDHVRSVFLDLCSGLTPGELQQTYPHHWGLLLSRLVHRPDLRLELLDRVNRRL